MATKKEIFAFVLLIVITLGLTSAAVYEQAHRKAVTAAAVVKADKQRDTATASAEAYKLNLQSTNIEAQALSTNNKHLCAVLVAHKLTDPVCTTAQE